MKEKVNLMLQDLHQAWHVCVAVAEVDAVLGAMAADPMTLSELQYALGRFLSAAARDRIFASAVACTDEGRWSFSGGGEVDLAVDLVAQVALLQEKTVTSPLRVQIPASLRHGNGHGPETTLEYSADWSAHWQVVDSRKAWDTAVHSRRDDRVRTRTTDRRVVLYGD